MIISGKSCPPDATDRTTSLSTIRLWLLAPQLLDDPLVRRRAASMVPSIDIARAHRFADERDRRAFLATRIVMRLALASELDVAPGDLDFALGGNGKPELRTRHAASVRFNASRTDGLAVCAVTRGAAVGVDVEAVRDPPLEIVDDFFSSPERAALVALPTASRGEAVVEIWTLKESFLKAHGGELSTLHEFAVERKPPRLLRFGPLRQEADSWRFVSFAPTPAHRLAVCVAGTADQAPPSVSLTWVVRSTLRGMSASNTTKQQACSA